MKAVRIIKVIVFVIAIISLLLSATGNFFIVKDAFDYKDQGIDVAEVKAQLDSYEYKVSSLFKASAEGNGEEPAEDPAVPGDEEIPADEETSDEDALTQDENDAFFGDTEDDGKDETFDGEEVPAELPAEEDIVPVDDGEEEPYYVGNHKNFVIGLMKLANWDWTDKVATEFKFENMKNYQDDGICAILNIVWQFGEPNVDFTVNGLLAISFLGITLAFILHLISKNVKKTFWGIVLMILGYIIFVINFVLGIVLGNCLSITDGSLTSYDLSMVRIFLVTGFTFLAVLLGLGYVRCGSRQMKIKDLKNRIKKLRAKKKAA